MLEGIYFPILDIRDPSIYGNSRVFGDSWFHAPAVQSAAKYVIWIDAVSVQGSLTERQPETVVIRNFKRPAAACEFLLFQIWPEYIIIFRQRGFATPHHRCVDVSNVTLGG